MARTDSGAAGAGPPPCVALGVAIVNAVTGNDGRGAKSAAAAGKPKGSDGKR